MPVWCQLDLGNCDGQFIDGDIVDVSCKRLIHCLMMGDELLLKHSPVKNPILTMIYSYSLTFIVSNTSVRSYSKVQINFVKKSIPCMCCF